MTTIVDTLERLRARYGPTMDNDECVEMLNEAAWIHLDEAWYLSKKETGDGVGHRHDGALLSHDVLMRRDGTYWDALDAAGAASRVSMDPAKPDGTITDPARGPIAPIAPLGSGPQPPTPPRPPAPDLAGLLQAHQTVMLTALQEATQTLARDLRQVADQLVTVTRRLAAVEDGVHETATIRMVEEAASRREALAGLIVERVASEADRILKARVCRLGGKLFADADPDTDPAGPTPA